MGLFDNANMPYLMGGLGMLSAAGPSLTPNNRYGGLAEGLMNGMVMQQRQKMFAAQQQTQQQMNAYRQQQMAMLQQQTQAEQQRQAAYAALFGPTAAGGAQGAPQGPAPALQPPATQAPMAWSPAGGARAAAGLQQPAPPGGMASPTAAGQGGGSSLLGGPAGAAGGAGQHLTPIQQMFPGVTPAELAAAQQMSPADGMKYLADNAAKRAEPKERRIIQGADGHQYYADDGTRVLPNVQKPPEGISFGQPVRAIGPDGRPTFVQVSKDGQVRAVEGYAPIPNGMKIESDGQGGFTLTQGDLSGNTQGLAKSTESTIQKELASLEETSARIGDLDQRYNRDFLTYAGRITSSISAIKDKADIDLSPNERQFLKDRTKFVTLVNREFNAYRKEITGAAASVQELESLKKATIDSEQSPAQFEANMDAYKEELQRAMRIKRRLLREGLAVGAKEFGGRFDDLYMGGGDDDETARYQELLGAGLSDEAALQKMIAEGY